MDRDRASGTGAQQLRVTWPAGLDRRPDPGRAALGAAGGRARRPARRPGPHERCGHRRDRHGQRPVVRRRRRPGQAHGRRNGERRVDDRRRRRARRCDRLRGVRLLLAGPERGDADLLGLRRRHDVAPAHPGRHDDAGCGRRRVAQGRRHRPWRSPASGTCGSSGRRAARPSGRSSSARSGSSPRGRAAARRAASTRRRRPTAPTASEECRRSPGPPRGRRSTASCSPRTPTCPTRWPAPARRARRGPPTSRSTSRPPTTGRSRRSTGRGDLVGRGHLHHGDPTDRPEGGRRLRVVRDRRRPWPRRTCATRAVAPSRRRSWPPVRAGRR